MASEPIENGVVEIVDGMITAIHKKPDARTIDLGNVAILPGLINAHTHLEFSDISQPLQPRAPFTDWIRSVVSHRRNRISPAEAIIKQGVMESLQSGTRGLGEIATDDDTPNAILRNSTGTDRGIGQEVRAVVFRELIGMQPERIPEKISIATEFLKSAGHEEETNITRGLSPHAPYSVHPELFRELVGLCQAEKAPLAMHLAETEAELEFLAKGQGEFVEMLKGFGIWREGFLPNGLRILDYLESLADVERAMVIHGNYLDEDEITFLSKNPQLTVVYCPRTHAYFGHKNHPWPRLLEAGVRVALGTDSRASNPDLNLWEEIKFLRARHPEIPPIEWIQWATQNGAAALFGPETNLGTLEIGHPAQFAIVPLERSDATNLDLALFG